MDALFQDLRYAIRSLRTSPSFTCAIALFAAYVPARRAARVDPIVALRAE